MPPLLLVMLGGAVGAGARHLTGGAFVRLFGPAFPWGTLTINIVGGLLMGVLAGVLSRGGGSEAWRLLIGVGVLGGFTTFSAFSLDTVMMIERGAFAPALAYVAVSVIGSVAALAAGLALVRSVPA